MRALKVVWTRECAVDAWAVHSVDVCSPGGISVTLNASRDSSQPFCVGKSGVGGMSSGAVSGVFRNERSNLPCRCCWCWC